MEKDQLIDRIKSLPHTKATLINIRGSDHLHVVQSKAYAVSTTDIRLDHADSPIWLETYLRNRLNEQFSELQDEQESDQEKIEQCRSEISECEIQMQERSVRIEAIQSVLKTLKTKRPGLSL
jgi:chromosome segregation ATPase